MLQSGSVLFEHTDEKVRWDRRRTVMKKTIIAFMVFLFCAISEMRSGLSVENEIDAITGATCRAGHDETYLPPKAGEYEVLGVREGLNGYVVKYDKTLYRGGALLGDSAIDTLRELGIKTIISITPTDSERRFSMQNGYKLVEIPFENATGPSHSEIALLLKSIKKLQGPFYLHCHGGAHRAGVLGAAYRIHVLGWTFEKAIVEYGRLGGDLLKDHAMLEKIRIY